MIGDGEVASRIEFAGSLQRRKAEFVTQLTIGVRLCRSQVGTKERIDVANLSRLIGSLGKSNQPGRDDAITKKLASSVVLSIVELLMYL